MAHRTLDLKSQCFASRTIVDAMAERLSEPDGPEIVLVNPEAAQGRLEASPDPAVDHAVRSTILSLRNHLMSDEHLSVAQDVLEASLGRWNGSLLIAIDRTIPAALQGA